MQKQLLIYIFTCRKLHLINDELLNSNLIRPELDLSSVPVSATDFSNIFPAHADVANRVIDAITLYALGTWKTC